MHGNVTVGINLVTPGMAWSGAARRHGVSLCVIIDASIPRRRPPRPRPAAKDSEKVLELQKYSISPELADNDLARPPRARASAHVRCVRASMCTAHAMH